MVFSYVESSVLLSSTAILGRDTYFPLSIPYKLRYLYISLTEHQLSNVRHSHYAPPLTDQWYIVRTTVSFASGCGLLGTSSSGCRDP